MARYDDNYQDSAVDVESDAGSIMATPAEDSPLLPTDLPVDIVPDKRFQHLVIGMCALLLFIIEVCQYVMQAPMQSIMEDIICRDQFPDHQLGVHSIMDHRCKDRATQKELAMLRSWTTTIEMFVRECAASLSSVPSLTAVKHFSCRSRMVSSQINTAGGQS